MKYSMCTNIYGTLRQKDRGFLTPPKWYVKTRYGSPS